MKIFAISDLHLPSSSDKKQDMFGEDWVDHANKIRRNWVRKIKKNDIILIPGDISWALKWEEAIVDLEYLADLPGKKIISEGNHDYWLYSKRNQKKELLKEFDNDISTIRYIHNDSVNVHFHGKKLGIAAIKGWSHRVQGADQDEKLIKRQLLRLQASIDSIEEDVDSMIIMMHYPPSSRVFHSSKEREKAFKFERFDERFWDLIRSYNPDAVLFGHLHRTNLPINQILDGINVYCVAADLIGFDPIEVKV